MPLDLPPSHLHQPPAIVYVMQHGGGGHFQFHRPNDVIVGPEVRRHSAPVFRPNDVIVGPESRPGPTLPTGSSHGPNDVIVGPETGPISIERLSNR